MPGRYATDTHALVWHLEGNSRLGNGARSALEDPHSVLFLPIIALAEAVWMVEHGRCRIPTVAQLLADVDADPRIVLVPLDRATLDRSVTLTTVGEMHDRLIVATTLRLAENGEGMVLLTRDASIVQSGLVSTLW